MMSLVFIAIAIIAPWVGLGLLVKIIWKDCAHEGEGAFFRNHLELESYLVGLLWPVLLPFFLVLITIYGLVSLSLWAVNREKYTPKYTNH